MPKVSVIMPAYNVENYVGEAVKSILIQTFEDLELIVVENGSTDGTFEALKNFTDTRLKVIQQDHTVVSQARNRGIKKASGDFIATLDADDLAVPDRIEKQVDFLEQNPKYGIVGSYCYVKNEQTGKVTQSPRPLSDSEIRRAILMMNPFIHSATVFRMEALVQVGLYHPPKIDFDLIIRILSEFKGANLPEYLCIRRERPEGFILGDQFSEMLKRILMFRIQAIKELNIPFWRWPEMMVPVFGLLLFKLGFNKEIGHQIVSNGFIDLFKRFLHLNTKCKSVTSD